VIDTICADLSIVGMLMPQGDARFVVFTKSLQDLVAFKYNLSKIKYESSLRDLNRQQYTADISGHARDIEDDSGECRCHMATFKPFKRTSKDYRKIQAIKTVRGDDYV
jgi:hypothetical protein